MEDIEAMIEQLKQNFGNAETEDVSENGYKYSNRNKNMREDIAFVQAQANKSNRLYFKDQFGFDK